jgi:hypothetical protein
MPNPTALTAEPPRGPSTDPFNRHYRLPSMARWLARGFLLFAALVVLGSLLDNQSDVSPAVVAVPAYTVLAGVALWGERVVIRGGLYETTDGLRVVNCWGTSAFRWERIERFERSGSRPTSRVLIIGTDGQATAIIGTAQGGLIRWDGGETTDIVGELNERLARWRSGNAVDAAPGRLSDEDEPFSTDA